MNPRTAMKIDLAAAECEPANQREAAAIGGLVRSLKDRGHFDHGYALNAGTKLLRDFAADQRCRPLFDESFHAAPITMRELGSAVTEFQRRYNPPRAAA